MLHSQHHTMLTRLGESGGDDFTQPADCREAASWFRCDIFIQPRRQLSGYSSAFNCPAISPKSGQNECHPLRYPLELRDRLPFVIEGPVAQRLEQGTHNPLVGGSNPSGPTRHLRCGRCSLFARRSDSAKTPLF